MNLTRCEREYCPLTHIKGHRGYAIIVVHNLTHNFGVHIIKRCGCKAFDAMRLAVVGDSFLAAIGYKLNRIPQFLGTIRYRKLAILYIKLHIMAAEVCVRAYKRGARQSHCVFADICARSFGCLAIFQHDIVVRKFVRKFRRAFDGIALY